MIGKKSKNLYTLEEVVSRKKRERMSNFYKCARTVFVAESMAQWEEAARGVVLSASRVLSTHCQTIMASLKQFPRLYRLASEMTTSLMTDICQECMEDVLELMHREIASDFTLSSARLHATYSQALEQLQTALDLQPSGSELDEQYEEIEAARIMATAISYYDLSFRRFSDVTALAIEHILFRGFCAKLDSSSRKHLRQAAVDKLLIEDPNIARRRADLESQMTALSRIQVELRLITVTNEAEDPLHLALMEQDGDTSDDHHSAPPPKQDGSGKSKKKKKKGWFGSKTVVDKE